MNRKTMKPRERFLRALNHESTDVTPVGNPVSIATIDLMEATGCFFPDVHNDAKQMARLAAAGHEILGYDTVAPYFSVVQEAAALGALVDWGARDRMPAVRPFANGSYLVGAPSQFKVPDDFIERGPTRVVLDAISILGERFDDRVAIVGKVFGPWTMAYHLVGIEPFLILIKDDPGMVHALLKAFLEVAILFGQAQMDAGADCLTLADHLTGDLCSAETYQDFLFPAHREIRSRLHCPICFTFAVIRWTGWSTSVRQGLMLFISIRKTTRGKLCGLRAAGLLLLATSTTRRHSTGATAMQSSARSGTLSMQVLT